MTFNEQVIIEVIKLGLSIIFLFITWGIGQSILTYWEVKKKRKELDIQTVQRLQELIGEWKTVWRLWKVYKENAANSLNKPEYTRWELLSRVSAAEGGIEAILLKIASERSITKGDCEQLGLFRQAYQQLREAIRDDNSILWDRKDPEYWMFHELSVRVTYIFEGSEAKRSAEDANANLKKILSVNKPLWNDAVKKHKSQQVIS